MIKFQGSAQTLRPHFGKRGFVIATLLLLAILIVEIFVREPLFETSIRIIITIQNNVPRPFRYFFHAAAGLGDPDIILPVYLLILALQVNKFFLIKLGLYISFIGYFLSVTKTSYASPRPYWVSPCNDTCQVTDFGDFIIPFEKYAEYGNPSGHAFFTLALYGYLFYLFTIQQHKKGVSSTHDLVTPLKTDEENLDSNVEEKNINMPAEEAAGMGLSKHAPFNKNVYRVMIVLFFIAVASVCTSRMYLGMHSLNQVLLGLSFGAYFLFVFATYIDRKLEHFLKAIAKQELTNRPLMIWSFCVIYMLASLIPIALYIMNNEINSTDSSVLWKKYWKVVNHEVGIQPNAFAYIRCLLDSGVIGGFFGIMIGALASDGHYTETAISFHKIPKMKIFFRVLVFALVAALPAAVVAFIPTPEQNYILTYFVRWNLALFVAGFSATNFVPIAYSKFDLDVEGDFLRLKTRQLEKTLSGV